MSALMNGEREDLKKVLNHLGLAYQCLDSAVRKLPDSAGKLARASVVDAKETLAIAIEAVEEAGR